MNGHGPVLQKRVHAPERSGTGKVSIGIEVAFRHGNERAVVFGEEQNAHEASQHQLDDDQRHAIELFGALHVAKRHYGGKQRDEPCPEQQRALAAFPQTGNAIQRSQNARLLALRTNDVFDARITREEAVHKQAAAERERQERDDDGNVTAPYQRLARTLRVAGAKGDAGDQADHGHDNARKANQQPHQTNECHR